MNTPFQDYLHLLDQIRKELERLCTLTDQKMAAARNSDLNAMDDVMRQEQASSLAFRGFEQKQSKLLDAMGMKHVPLSKLAGCYPPELQAQAGETISQLKAQYQRYTKLSGAARQLLEQGIRDIEGTLKRAAAANGPGYQPTPSPLETPEPMKTDFRA